MAGLLIERFTGDNGKEALRRALLRNPVVANCDARLLEFLIENGQLRSVAIGESIIVQGDTSDDVFFVLAGSFDVLVHGRSVAERQIGDHVGEMAALAEHLTRSATQKAKKESVVLVVSKHIFLDLLKSSEKAIQAATRVLVERLESRNKLVKPSNTRPKVFIISSVEGLKVADEIKKQFFHDPFEVDRWAENTFEPSSYPLPDLFKKISDSDFCVVVAKPDDKLHRRDEDYVVPRDNVILEAGMSIGALGVSRTFIVKPQMDKGALPQMALPTDLAGLTPLEYKINGDTFDVSNVCHELRRKINEFGVR